MTDVGNRHNQPITVGAADLDRLAIDGIVEIAGVFAVDRYHRHVAQIDAIGQIGGTYFARQLGSQFLGSFGEFMRHAVFAHRNFDFHARIVDITQDFDNLADRLGKTRWLLGQLDADYLPGLGFARRTGQDDVLSDTLVFGSDHPDPVFVEQTADHVGIRA